MKKIIIVFMAILVFIGCNKLTDHKRHEHPDPNIYYTCSMDPQVLETKPGKCSICHMDLTPISKEQIQENGLKLSKEQLKLTNIKTAKVALGSISQEITTTGIVKENENNAYLLSSKLEGRIEHLYVKTSGSTITKGQILFRIYSEMLAATQSEFIQNWKLMQKNPDSPLYSSIYVSAVNKLKTWGLTTLQIEQLKILNKPPIPYPILSPVTGVVKSIRMAEGDAVMEGTPIMELTEYTSLWVEAQFPQTESAEIKSGDNVRVNISGSTQELEGKVIEVLPQVAPSSTVSIVRITIKNEGMITPGMQAIITWAKSGRRVLTIPQRAVIQEPEGAIVWVKNKKDIFEPRMVHLGASTSANAEVLHGLAEGDEIVVSGVYLLQSEYVFKKGNKLMAGHNH